MAWSGAMAVVAVDLPVEDGGDGVFGGGHEFAGALLSSGFVTNPFDKNDDLAGELLVGGFVGGFFVFFGVGSEPVLVGADDVEVEEVWAARVGAGLDVDGCAGVGDFSDEAEIEAVFGVVVGRVEPNRHARLQGGFDAAPGAFKPGLRGIDEGFHLGVGIDRAEVADDFHGLSLGVLARNDRRPSVDKTFSQPSIAAFLGFEELVERHGPFEVGASKGVV